MRSILIGVALIAGMLELPINAQENRPEQDKTSIPPATTFKSNGVDINYRESGSGEVVVFVHGMSMNSWSTWKAHPRLLADDFRVVAVDLRGHGNSGKPHDAEAYGMQMVEDLKNLLDHLELKDAHFIGISLGGRVVTKLTTTYPDRVRTATIVSPPGLAGKDAFEAEAALVAKGLRDGKGFSPLIRSMMTPENKTSDLMVEFISKQMLYKNDPLAFAALAEALPNLHTDEEELRKCKVPIAAIIGSKERDVEHMRSFAKNLEKSELIVLDGMDHQGACLASEVRDSVRKLIETYTQNR